MIKLCKLQWTCNSLCTRYSTDTIIQQKMWLCMLRVPSIFTCFHTALACRALNFHHISKNIPRMRVKYTLCKNRILFVHCIKTSKDLAK